MLVRYLLFFNLLGLSRNKGDLDLTLTLIKLRLECGYATGIFIPHHSFVISSSVGT
jgi:hypothetical protein